MNKILISLVFLGLFMAFDGTARAGQSRENCGCGLGTLLWADKADGSISYNFV